MKKNALYIHGFMGNPKGGTFETLNKTLKNWNVHSIPFPDLHTDILKTQRLIKAYCKENDIEMLIGASLGAFYVLQHEDIIDKLVINPCMYPSVEIPKLKDRTTGDPIVLSKEVLSGLIKWKNTRTFQKSKSSAFSEFLQKTMSCFILKIPLTNYSATQNARCQTAF